MPEDTFEIDPYFDESLRELMDRIMGIEQPDPFMEEFYSSTGIGPGQIGDYITKMFSGVGAKRKAGEFETRGLEDVNRIATQMFNRERLRSSATGGRGSSAAAALKAKGGGILAGKRSDVRGQAAELEEMLRGQMFTRGRGALGAWEGATRGDWEQTREYGDLMLGATSPALGGSALQLQQFITWLENKKWEREWEGSVPPPD